MMDIDGVVSDDIPNEFPDLMKTASEIPGSKDWINSKYDEGSYICFFTARLEEHREVTEKWLREHGFKYHQIIFGKPRRMEYHYIDNLHVRATTFTGKFSSLVQKNVTIQVFDDN